MGSSVTPWKCHVCSSVKKLFRVSQKTFWLYLFIVAKRRFFIAALICQLIIFSYKIQPWLRVSILYFIMIPVGEVQGDL